MAFLHSENFNAQYVPKIPMDSWNKFFILDADFTRFFFTLVFAPDFQTDLF